MNTPRPCPFCGQRLTEKKPGTWHHLPDGRCVLRSLAVSDDRYAVGALPLSTWNSGGLHYDKDSRSFNYDGRGVLVTLEQLNTLLPQ